MRRWDSLFLCFSLFLCVRHGIAELVQLSKLWNDEKMAEGVGGLTRGNEPCTGPVRDVQSKLRVLHSPYS